MILVFVHVLGGRWTTLVRGLLIIQRGIEFVLNEFGKMAET